MTAQHYDFKIVTKTKGHNIIAKSAYNARKTMFDELEQKNKYSHTSNKDHLETVVLLPDGAPAKYKEPTTLWNDVQRNESGRMAKNLIIAIPKELEPKIGKELVLEHIKREFVSKGFCCQVDFHLSHGKSGKPNFHAHVIVSERQLVNGKWAKAKSHKVYIDENNKIIEPILSPKLHFGKLQFDKNNNVIMEPGYKKLQYDQDGKPLLDEKGYPVTIDIRVPAKTKNPKRKTWRERKERLTDIDEKGNVEKLREAWQNIQNEYFEKYNVRTENGELLQVDHRPFKEKYKDVPEELRPEPTKRSKGGIVRETIIEYNKSVMERRRLIKTALEKEAQIRTKKFIFAQKQVAEINAIIDAEEKFCNDLNPKKLFVDRWETNYNSLKTQVEEHDRKVVEMLRRNLDINQQQRNNIKSDKKKTAKLKRLNRHAAAMKQIENSILLFGSKNNINIVSLAGQSYDKLNNSEKTAFVRNVIGDKTARIYANFLTRNKPDNSNALDGLTIKPPGFPSENTNTKILENATEAIAGEKSISIDWNTLTGEAPPKKVIDSVNSYHTALAFYTDKLNGNQWRTQTIVESDKIETPEKINKDFQEEISEIDKSLLTQQSQSTKKISFTGSIEERCDQVIKICEQTESKEIPYSYEIKKAISDELLNIKKEVIKTVYERLSPTQQLELLNKCAKNPTMSNDEKIVDYFKRRSKDFTNYVNKTNSNYEYKLYAKFATYNTNYFHLADNQKTTQTQKTQQQKDGQDLGR